MSSCVGACRVCEGQAEDVALCRTTFYSLPVVSGCHGFSRVILPFESVFIVEISYRLA